MAERPKLFKVGDEMRRWCAILEEEVSSWPEVSAKPMFGMVAFYRNKRIFACVPRTRAADTERSVMLKLPGVKNRRLRRGSVGSEWVTFEIDSDRDIPEVLQWLERAHRSTQAKK